MTRSRREHAATAGGLVAGLLALVLAGCSKHQLVDLAMASAPHPRTRPDQRAAADGLAAPSTLGPYQILAGDMHCHVLPPDSPWHVSRDLLETARLATEANLDFVVLTPHVPARFFLDPEMREWVRGTQQVLRARAEALAPRPDGSGPRAPLLVPGMEYTDHRFGHIGLSFADVDAVLDDIPIDELLSNPSLFFEKWRAHGGIATINHPVVRPLPKAPFMELRYDLSWRGFAPAGSTETPVGLPEIRWLSEHADAIETYNMTAGHLRDQFFVGDPDWTMREGTHLLDRIARTQKRRVAPVGGSDSHGGWLRPTTFVLATDRTTPAIRDAIVHGRTCVRGPEGCTLEVRGRDGAFHPVGASIVSSSSSSHVHAIEARARGGPATYVVNGEIAATGADGETVRVPVPGRCALVRVVVERSASAPVYVDCPWAAPKR